MSKSILARDPMNTLPNPPGYQQEWLRNMSKELNMTQKALAQNIEVPWSTFRKWLLPDGTGDHRRMPGTAFAAIHYLQAVVYLRKRNDELNAEVTELRKQLRGKKKETKR